MVLSEVPPGANPAVTLYADGGTLNGNPSNIGVYWSVGNKDVGVIRYEDRSGKRRKSDEAEYLALLSALRLVLDLPLPFGSVALIHSDCRPVVKHVRHQRKPRSPYLRDLYWDAQEVLARLHERGIDVALQWVPRRVMVHVLGH